jgi:nitrous oxidase accessory protein NosD
MLSLTRLFAALALVAGVATSAHAADGDALLEHPGKSRQITASFLDSITVEAAIRAVSRPAPKSKLTRKLHTSPEAGSDPIGRIIALRTGNG